MRVKSALRIFQVILIGAVLAIPQGCKGKPKKEVVISPPKGRVAFSAPVAAGEGGEILAPDFALDSMGGAHIVYLRQFGSIHRVYYLKYDNSTNEFSHEIQLSQKEGIKSMGVTIDACGDALLAVWANADDAGRKLKFRRSNDQGRNFTLEKQFNGSREPSRWSVAGPSSEPLTFYTTTDNGESALVLNRGFDQEREHNLLGPGNHIRVVKAITGINGDIYVMCLIRETTSGGGEFKLLHSADGGETFTPYKIFPTSLFPFYKNAFDFATTSGEDGERLHLIWTERSKDGVRLMRARTIDENIEYWQTPEEVASTSKVENWICSQPLLATDKGKRAIIVYAYLVEGEEKVYRMVYRFSEDEGVTFQKEAMVTDDISSPEVITGGISIGGTIHIAWDDENPGKIGERRIMYVSGMVR